MSSRLFYRFFFLPAGRRNKGMDMKRAEGTEKGKPLTGGGHAKGTEQRKERKEKWESSSAARLGVIMVGRSGV